MEFALRAYQSRTGLRVTGRLDLETLATLQLLPGGRRPFFPQSRRDVLSHQFAVNGFLKIGWILLEIKSSHLSRSRSIEMHRLDGEDCADDFFMPERIQKPMEPAPWGPKQGDGGGPHSPDISRPDTKDLLKKMRKVDPNQSKRYRQRTGQ